MTEPVLDEVELVVDALKRVSPEEQEAAILELEERNPGIGERVRALLALERQAFEAIRKAEADGRRIVAEAKARAERKPDVEPKAKPELRIVEPAEKKPVEWKLVQRADGTKWRVKGNDWRRWFGPVPQLRVVEQAKPIEEAKKPEPKPEPEPEPRVQVGLVEEELELELADKRAQSLVSSNYGLGYLTPGASAQKPVVALNEFNAKHAVITNLGGKCVVMEWAPSQVDPQWEEPGYQSFTAFRERYSNRYVEIIDVLAKGVQKIGVQAAAEWWLCQPSRRQYHGLDMAPNGPAVLRGNRLNLWRGWGVKPEEGDWSKMRQHIWVVLANEEKRSDDYIVRWAAWKYQNAGERSEVALNFKGLKGTGKGVFMHSLLRAFGPHGLEIHNPMHLTGKHNKHLQNRLLLCADEAVWAGDKQAERQLKGMVTERTLTIEPKGVDAFAWPNRLGIVQSTNDKWVVPATWDERRYAVFEVNPLYIQQRKYFEPLFAEIDGGGAAAMLYDLLKMDLEGWHPRYDIPQTAALMDQKVQSLDGIQQWWLAKLDKGETPTAQPKNPRWVLSGRLLSDVTEHNARPSM